MMKWGANLFRTMLLAATLAAVAPPALAADIQTGDVCQKKIVPLSWHVCGAVPADGQISYVNVGIHELTVFTTRPEGITCDPPINYFEPVDSLDVGQCGIVQISRPDPLWPYEGASVPVCLGDLVYIARAETDVADRTLAIQFTAVPTNDDRADASPFSDTRMFVEFNATTEDVGIRAFLNGDPWDAVRTISPDERIFQASGGGKLGQLGLSELAFQTQASALEELLALFPEGEYRLQGRTVEGDKLLGAATLTHDIPDGPQILTPEDGVLVDFTDAVISWEPVTEPAGIEIVGYRVIVERGDRGRTLSLELPAETTSVLVPPDFLEPGTDYLFQVFAIEAGGNQTISEGVFDTADAGLGAAEDIKVGDICRKKIEGLSWHLCGAAAADGQIYYGNDGAVFTTGPAGTQCPPGINGMPITKSKSACDILQIGQPRPLQTFEWGSIKVSAGDLIYIARADRLLSDRTLAIKFCAGPGCG